MMLSPAGPEDLEAVSTLVNDAYRGGDGDRGWTHEADYIDGQRTSVEDLRADLARLGATLLLARDDSGAPLTGCVWLEPAADGAWYLGMLTVRPRLQAQGAGRRLLAAAEQYAAAKGARRIRMTVVSLRETLIDWYRRRGYEPTGEREPFPYDDERFGAPRVAGLEFIVLEKTLPSLCA
ncbi:MAG TPA: GNAT family N-acetyltransferase [Caulobacteraceae bacterium]|jgi:ribosomal protein S18 acetylase RimI-like enzyme|nr:GNAT family N-acetyltransferase [Caulobacteraceae bacterium]